MSARKPTRLKIAQGNPGKRPLNTCEPQPESGDQGCPTWLDGEAKAEWRRVTKELDRLGLLTKVDRASLACYCQAWAEFYEAKRELKKHGSRTITTDKGFALNHPAVSRMNAAWKAIRAFAGQFGLDPASRSKLHAPAKNSDDDDLEAFMREAK